MRKDKTISSYKFPKHVKFDFLHSSALEFFLIGMIFLCLVDRMTETNFRLFGNRNGVPDLNQNEQSGRYVLQENGGRETRGTMEVDDIELEIEKKDFEEKNINGHIAKIGKGERIESVGNNSFMVKNGGGELSGMKLETEFVDKKGTVSRGIKSCGYCYQTPSQFKYNDDDITPVVLLDGLVENTTVHGLPNCYQARGR